MEWLSQYLETNLEMENIKRNELLLKSAKINLVETSSKELS